MTQEHPITPPPELVQQWRNLPEYVSQLRTMSTVTITTERLQHIATQAARWGADQELLACGNYLEKCAAWEPEDVTEFYNYRRPKPPTLKEQALALLDKAEDPSWDINDFTIVRRALEQLPDSIVVFPSQC